MKAVVWANETDGGVRHNVTVRRLFKREGGRDLGAVRQLRPRRPARGDGGRAAGVGLDLRPGRLEAGPMTSNGRTSLLRHFEKDGLTIFRRDCRAGVPAPQVGDIGPGVTMDPPYLGTTPAAGTRHAAVAGDGDPAGCRRFAESSGCSDDAFAMTFYGWPHSDVFAARSEEAGFRLVSHLVFVKQSAWAVHARPARGRLPPREREHAVPLERTERGVIKMNLVDVHKKKKKKKKKTYCLHV